MTTLPSPIRTLIVEDDPQNAALYGHFLSENADFELLGYAENLRIARAMTQTLCPDLLLLDQYLPDGQGLELLHEVRQKNQPTDAILITVACDSGSVNEAVSQGAVDYLVKPIEQGRFQRSLQRAAERARLRHMDTVQQSDLDSFYFVPPAVCGGLDAATLQRVRILMREDVSLTARETGERLGLSRVSAWRYLEHLHQTGELEATSEANPVGRPSKRYRRA